MIPVLLDKFTIQDEVDCIREVKRPPEDVSFCLRAAEAASKLEIIGSLTRQQVAQVCQGEPLVGEEEEVLPILSEITSELEDMKKTLDLESDKPVPSAEVLKALKAEWKADVEEGGNYNEFLLFFEFLMQRLESPDLKWATWKADKKPQYGRAQIYERIAGWMKDLEKEYEQLNEAALEKAREAKDDGGNPLKEEQTSVGAQLTSDASTGTSSGTESESIGTSPGGTF